MKKYLLRLFCIACATALCALMGCSDSASSSSTLSNLNKVSSAQSVNPSSTQNDDVSADPSEQISSTEPSSKGSSPASSAVSSKATSSRKPTSSAVSSKATSSTISKYVQTIIDDMTLAHEGLPHGVPSNYSWAKKPRVGMGINVPDGWSAATAWGQVYEATEGNPATNTRVQLRNMRMYYFSKTEQKWIQLQSSTAVEGGAYRENFQGNANKDADQRNESSNGGGISVTAGDGYNYHFWPTVPRATIDPTDIAVIYSTCQARLILSDASKADDRSSARYLLSVGGDYWLDKSAGWQSFKTNGDWAIGRFRYVTTEWQNFSGWAGDTDIIINNPPPKE